MKAKRMKFSRIKNPILMMILIKLALLILIYKPKEMMNLIPSTLTFSNVKPILNYLKGCEIKNQNKILFILLFLLFYLQILNFNKL